MEEGCQSESAAFHSLTFEGPFFPFLDCHNLWNEGEALCLQTQCTPNRSSAKPGRTCWKATSSRPWRSWRRRPSRPCRRRSNWEPTAKGTRRRPSCSSWTSLLSSAETSMPSTPCSSATWTTTGTEASGQGRPAMEGWDRVLLQAREESHSCHHQHPRRLHPCCGTSGQRFPWPVVLYDQSGLAPRFILTGHWRRAAATPSTPCSSVTHSFERDYWLSGTVLGIRGQARTIQTKRCWPRELSLWQESGASKHKVLRHLQYTSLCTYIFTYILYFT